MRLFVFLVFCLSANVCFSQSAHYSRWDAHSNTARDYLMTYGDSLTHLSLGNIWRSDLKRISPNDIPNQYAHLIADNRDYFPAEYIQAEKGILRYIYSDRVNAVSITKPAFKVFLNPILHISAGTDNSQENPVFRNTRGFNLRGQIDKRVYFYTDLLETQANFLAYQNARFDSTFTIDGQGFYKPYTSSVSSLEGYDFLNARGYVGFKVSPHVSAELGHGRHFIGNGYHSLLLNDYAQNYFYLSLDTRVWKLHYKNIFAETAPLTANRTGVTKLLPKKYFAAHYLSFKPNKWLEVGLFESVTFSREDRFEFQYLNPIILYRTVEQFLDSPDNVLLGTNINIKVKDRLLLYGQIMIDELKFQELFNGNNWWGNKFGLQAGLLSYRTFGVEGLTIRLEGNLVRPYTYSHLWPLEAEENQSTASYSHFSQPLAHPLGSNFIEGVFTAEMPIGNNFRVLAKALAAKQGINTDSLNYGSNILIRNGTRVDNFGIDLLQGARQNILHLEADLRYRFFHNMELQTQLIYHRQTHRPTTVYAGLGVLINSFDFPVDY